MKVFVSYAWGLDDTGRSNFDRVSAFARALRAQGTEVWIDVDSLGCGSVDANIANAMEAADVIVVCLTRRYIEKVQCHVADPRQRDSCGKEWSYATCRCKFVQPVLMERELRSTHTWPPGVVAGYLGNSLYVDASDDVCQAAAQFCRLFERPQLARRQTRKPIRLPSLTRTSTRTSMERTGVDPGTPRAMCSLFRLPALRLHT